LNLLNDLAPAVNGWSEDLTIDCDDNGPMPRLNVSLKLSALYSQFRPIDPVGTAEAVKKRLRPILKRARKNMAYVHIDMEQYDYKDLTLEIFKDVLMEDEFREFPDVGIVIQAYLPDAEKDLHGLREFVAERGTPITVRLVKGAYWDYETVMCDQKNWPVPVFEEKWQSDDNFERLSRFLLENYESLRPAFASHNLRSLANAIAWARKLGVPKGAYEIQMLYGMGIDHAELFREQGHRVRIYTPFGELIPGMAYLVRRLLENTSNDSFLRHSLAEEITREKLMAKPAEPGAKGKKKAAKKKAAKKTTATEETVALKEVIEVDFTNEPLSDFSKAETREAMQSAVDDVEAELGKDYSLIIDGRTVDTKGQIVSRNPSNKSQVVGTISSASVANVLHAVEVANRTAPSWRSVELEHRVEYLLLIAKHIRERRFELAAWQVFECGKPWAEADADVAEAIDFCVYYAQQASDLLAPRSVNVSGEENTYFFKPRGVAAVITPWNFPLAILTGMTVAALVTGNTVVLKPAEQSSIVAAKFMEIIQDIGIPDGVVNFVPGIGEDIGPEIVSSRDVDLIAFTGSKDVGLEINRVAADNDPNQNFVKKVIAEMGGKNAIIIDNDADLDQAIVGVVDSAFGYAGQKCSACSRVIVLRDVYSTFVNRLIAATRSLKLGEANAPGTTIGPVIDEDAYARIMRYIEIGKEESKLLPEYPVEETLQKQGYFIGPHIFVDVEPDARIAQEEVFGPVLAVIPVDHMNDALSVANSTDFALSGAIFSRSPANLKLACENFEVGNLYLNRGTTGALVNRQPFGGFRMSGTGTKAGGPDYLAQFVLPVNITENTMRRGFAPISE
jgi:RHH-type proline utilization regulon transcriptional repressor/proline dehydrogenase/delta 1-pyrroline-5-carboxylate dehydrogenase